MDKLKMHSPDLTQAHLARIRELFPGCVTEARGKDGTVRLAIDFDHLRQELSDVIVEGPQERYQLNWPGKREALLAANTPIRKTLRPCRDESVHFDTTKNLFVQGDNLEALKLLQESLLGKVKLIYIDPPYNTGNEFIYNDTFSESSDEYLVKSNQTNDDTARLVANPETSGRFHSNWLSMMYARLRSARSLLREDGCIAISIDENEVQNLWKVCEEVFGRDSFVECLVYEKKAAAKGVPPVKMIVGVHEYILVFQKSSAFKFIGVPRSTDGFSNPDNDPRGIWRNTNCKSTVNDSSKAFSVEDPATHLKFTDTWAHSPEEMKRMAETGQLIFPKSADGQVRKKEYYNEFKNSNTPIKSSLGLYDAQKNTQMLEELLGGKYFQNAKHLQLMKDFLSYVCEDGDIILDFFAGSSTTAHAIFELNAQDGRNRPFIMVQFPEQCDEKSEAFKGGHATIAELSKVRLRRAGKKVLKGECHAEWRKDVGFRVLKIDSSNLTDVHYTPDHTTQQQTSLFTSHIKPDRTAEDLLFQVLLDWGIDLTLPIASETVSGKQVLLVDTNALAACFDLEITETLITALAKRQPLRAVFRDDGFKDDATKINCEQIFKQLSPTTDVKVI